jgi:hypothetical protein
VTIRTSSIFSLSPTPWVICTARLFNLYEAGFSCAQAFALANKMEAPRNGVFGHHYEILEYLIEGSQAQSLFPRAA